MTNPNLNQCGTQKTGLGDMIGCFFPDNQHGEPSRHPANVDYFYFRYTKMKETIQLRDIKEKIDSRRQQEKNNQQLF